MVILPLLPTSRAWYPQVFLWWLVLTLKELTAMSPFMSVPPKSPSPDPWPSFHYFVICYSLICPHTCCLFSLTRT
jgi:hypothetical protein